MPINGTNMPDSKNKHSIHKNFIDLMFLMDRKMKEMVQEEDSGLSMLQITLLRILTIEGEKSLIEIAQIIGKDKSQITRTVQELEKMGIVRKERSEKDRRSFILKLNVGVKEKVSFYIMKEQELIDAMLAGVSQNEREILDKLLLQMHVNLTLNS